MAIWEDGSNDDTVAKLRSWASRNPKLRLLLGSTPRWMGTSIFNKRVSRIAFCRNVLLAEALRDEVLPFTSSPSPSSGHSNRGLAALSVPPPLKRPPMPRILLSVDLDCPPVLAPSAVAHAVGGLMGLGGGRRAAESSAGGVGAGAGAGRQRAAGRWDALFGNSVSRYYDLWALRSNALGIDYDCLHNKSAIRTQGVCFEYDVALDPNAPVLEVDSAFNGVGIYRLDSLRRAREQQSGSCRYGGAWLTTCEHVDFHACLRRAGLRLGIAPSLVQGCGAQHAHDEVKRTRRVELRADGVVDKRLVASPS